MITRQGFPQTTDPNHWIGRSGKASWYPSTRQYRVIGGQPPAGALATGGSPMLAMIKPRLMADPSDPSTWQRPYRFTGGQIGTAGGTLS